MNVEKRASKGGFLQLFDWNAKSRKKLFSNKSELPEGSNQGKEKVVNATILHPQLMEVHVNGPDPRGKGSSDYNLASSVSGDEGFVARAPSVVARLMGLDSLPTSNGSEPCCTPFCDYPFANDSHSQKANAANPAIEHHNTSDMSNYRTSRNLAEQRLQNVHDRPIDRFQIETLPPKSAKTIPITHHRLLSPIKHPGFIPTNNFAYIMEATAKIIEQGPSSTIKSKMPSFGSSSVPLRIRHLKERMGATQKASRLPEAYQRPSEPNSVNYMKGEHSQRSQIGSKDTQLFNASMDSPKDGSDSLKKRGKSVSLAIQAKVNVKRREGLAPCSNGSSINRQGGDDVKLDQHIKNQKNMQKGARKRTSTSSMSDVLRQNNQKQNCVANKDRLSSKASVSNQQDRKFPSINGSLRPNKVINSATGSRKKNSLANDTGKELRSSKTKIFSQKKSPVHGDIHLEKDVSKSILINKDEKCVRCNVAIDGCMNWDPVNWKNSMNVVSFTFTSPSKRSALSSGPAMEKNSDDDNNQCKSKNVTSQGLNVIGGDALSVLLEKKLKELTCKVESSQCNFVEAGSASCSAFSLQDSLSTLNVINAPSSEHGNSFQLNMQEVKSSYPCGVGCFSVDGLLLKAKQKCEGSDEMEGQSSNSECGKILDSGYPLPLSGLEPSSSGGSSSLSDTKKGSITNGCKQSSLAKPCQMVDCISATKHLPAEVEPEFSDSASSILVPFSLKDFKRSSTWELKYITKILCNAELVLKDFVLGQVSTVITPDLFDRLESQKLGFDDDAEDYFRLGRKLLFDCVSECLESTRYQLFGGSCRAWSRWGTLVPRRGWLAAELYREISSWTSMGELMVDELVEKDMSSGYGRWADFGIEAFEEGVEIEKGILTSLVDELVDDFFLI